MKKVLDRHLHCSVIKFRKTALIESNISERLDHRKLQENVILYSDQYCSIDVDGSNNLLSGVLIL